MKSVKVLLVRAARAPGKQDPRLPALPEPLALETLAAAIPDEDVRICDVTAGDNLTSILRDFAPDIVGLTCLTTEVYDAIEASVIARRELPDAWILVGGIHASLLPEDFMLDTIDGIVIGEGEEPLRALVAAKKKGESLRPMPKLICRDRSGAFTRGEGAYPQVDLDSRKTPRRDLTAAHRKDYYFMHSRPCASLEASRGCPFACKFCSVWKFHKGWRGACAERVAEEIMKIEEPHMIFVDDNFLHDTDRAYAVAKILKDRGYHRDIGIQARSDTIAKHPELIEQWKEVGLSTILIGFESVDPKYLKKIRKQNSLETNNKAIDIMHACDVRIWGAFIVMPSFSRDDFKRLRDYVNDRGVEFRQFTILTPLPGTPLYDEQKDILTTTDYRLFDALHAVVPTEMPLDDFYAEFAKTYSSYRLSGIFKRIFTGKLGLIELVDYIGMLRVAGSPDFYKSGHSLGPHVPTGLEIMQGARKPEELVAMVDA